MAKLYYVVSYDLGKERFEVSEYVKGPVKSISGTWRDLRADEWMTDAEVFSKIKKTLGSLGKRDQWLPTETTHTTFTD